MNKTLIRWLLGLMLLAAVGVAFTLRKHFDAAAVQAWIEGAGMVAPLLFMAIYALATVLFLPGSIITLAGGALFGPLWGTLWNLSGATLGAALAFFWLRAIWAQAGWHGAPGRGCNGSMTAWLLRDGVLLPWCVWYRCCRSTC